MSSGMLPSSVGFYWNLCLSECISFRFVHGCLVNAHMLDQATMASALDLSSIVVTPASAKINAVRVFLGTLRAILRAEF